MGRLLLVEKLLCGDCGRYDRSHRQEVHRVRTGLMRKTFKYRLYPTKETEKKLYWTLTRCRELYNAALTERRDAYTFHVRQHPNYYDEETRKALTKELIVKYSTQQNALPEIKAELREEYREIAAHVLQDVLRRLDKAFQNFFRRVREGASEPGYPRFKG